MSELSAAQSRVVGASPQVPDGVEWPHIAYDIADLGTLPFDEIYRRTGSVGAANRGRTVPSLVGEAAVVRVAEPKRPTQAWYAMCDGAGMWAADQEAAEAEIRRHIDFHAQYWMEKVQWRLWGDRNAARGGQQVIRCGGTHYVIGDSNARGMRGFGGREFRFRLIANGQEIVSTNVWFQGPIPAEFRDLLPDNAISAPSPAGEETT